MLHLRFFEQYWKRQILELQLRAKNRKRLLRKK